MTIKKIIPIIFLGLLLSGCGANKAADTKKSNPAGSKILINELPLKDKPFITLVPHSTNRLFTFVGLNINNAAESSLDLEYQSGDLLKGVKANIDAPIPQTFIKAIILGSCSTGGKCSFDKDLKTGTTKLRLKFANQNVIHLLKGDFTFISGQPSLPDGKVAFQASKATAKENIIMMNSFGLPKPVDKELSLYPVVFSATSDKIVSGLLTLSAQATSALIYNGTDYVPLKTTTRDGKIIVDLNQKPWSMSAEIIRDDEKGSKESLNLYLVGPILLVK